MLLRHLSLLFSNNNSTKQFHRSSVLTYKFSTSQQAKKSFNNSKINFQSQLGLKNKQTILGRIRRFQRKRPKLAQMIRFYIIFIFFALIILSTVPGIFSYSIKIYIGNGLPFQKTLKRFIFHCKHKLNKYWNLDLSNQRQKYLYLLFQDILQMFNYHQIYDIKQIHRVMGQLQKIIQQEQQINKILKQKQKQNQQKQKQSENYINVKLNKQIQRQNNLSNILKNQIKYKNQNQIIDKRQQMKNKLRKEIQINLIQKENKNNKIQERNTNNYQEQLKDTKTVKNKQYQQKKEQQNEQYLNKKQPNDKTVQQQAKVKQQKQQQQLLTSFAFRQTIIMYYNLILQNIIRHETSLLISPILYKHYWYLFQKFIFPYKRQNNQLIDQNSPFFQKNNQSFQLSLQNKNKNIQLQKIQKQQRQRLFFNSLIFQSSTIDLHQIFTYLINYRHLINKNSQNTSIKNNGNKNNAMNVQQQVKIKSLLIEYLKIIGWKKNTKNQINKQKQINVNSINSDKNDYSNKLIELGLKNKQFINSLKKLYIQDKQKNIKQKIPIMNNEKNLQSQNQKSQKSTFWNKIVKFFTFSKNNQQNKSRFQQNKQLQKQINLQKMPIYKILQQIFEQFDNHYKKSQKQQI